MNGFSENDYLDIFTAIEQLVYVRGLTILNCSVMLKGYFEALVISCVK